VRNAAARSTCWFRRCASHGYSPGLGLPWHFPDTLYKYASEGFVPAFKLATAGASSVRGWTSGWTASRTCTLADAEIDPEKKKPCAAAM